MPASSLFLRSCTTLICVLCFSLVSIVAATSSGYTYTLHKEYTGSSFFDEWDFFNGADPNNGFVTRTASNSGLINISNGNVFLRVDSSKSYDTNTPFRGNNGYGRPSVRIESRQSFYHGLIIADFKHMPSGCGTWPAFWALGAEGQWPNSGEIDILEGVNNRRNGLAALHTGGQCKITGDSRTMTGALQSNDCRYDVNTGQGAVGCTVINTDSHSYGAGLNAAGGSVFAMEWTSDAIKIWSFPGSSVPADIVAGQPDPSTWDLPAQVFNGLDCDINNVIKPQKLIINTNFCGDFGEAVWSSEGCAAQTGYDSCASYVASNPKAFADAYWQIGYSRHFQRGATQATSTTSEPVVSNTSATTLATVTSSTTTFDSAPTTSGTIVPTRTVTTDMNSISTSIAALSSSTIASETTLVVSVTTITSDGVETALSSTTNLAMTSSTITTRTLHSTSRLLSDTIESTLTLRLSVPSSSTTLPSTSGNTIGPVLTSGSSIMISTTTTTPLILTTGNPQGSIFLPPMGSGILITSGWNATKPVGQWETWPTSSATVPTSKWSNSATEITLTNTWVEPCETGYTTKTAYLTTVHCGCIEDPVPTVLMKVVTTRYPETWGFSTPVVVTIPDTATVTWTGWSVKPTAKASETQSWQKWISGSLSNEDSGRTWTLPPTEFTGAINVYAAPSWTEWSTRSSANPDHTNTKTRAEWSSIEAPAADSTWATWSKTRPVDTLSTQTDWQALPMTAVEALTLTVIPVPIASSSLSPQAWNKWDGNGSTNPYVAKWTGTASKMTFGTALLGVGFAVVALVL